MSAAPTSSAISRNGLKSMARGKGRAARDDELRAMLAREIADLVEVDPLGVLPDPVRHDRVELAREAHRTARGEVPAVGQVRRQHRVAGLEQREVDGHVRLRARVRLDIDVLGAEQLAGARDRELLGPVDDLAAAVIAPARIALRVLVGEHRADRLEHRLGDEVLRRDQLEVARLPLGLRPDDVGDVGIDLVQGFHGASSNDARNLTLRRAPVSRRPLDIGDGPHHQCPRHPRLAGRLARAPGQVRYAVPRRAARSGARAQGGPAMFFELRQYHIRPGQRENWVKCMEEEIIPFQVKMGMVILGSFVGEEDQSVYVWIRRFENEPERKRLYDAVYQSDYWKNDISPRVGAMIDREKIVVTRLVATPHSVIQ
jgi:hypothetical protein